MAITDADIANAKIEYAATGTNNKEITQNILNEWRTSETIYDMKEAQAYSLVKNTKIDEKTRAYYDEHDHLIENKHLSNVKTKTAQYRKSLLQKLDFTMAKPFVISCDDDDYKEAWDNFLSTETRAVIRKTAKEGINKGIGWTYPWIDENGKLKLMSIDSITGYPAWADEAHTELDAFVRDYQVIQYINQTPQTIYKVEYWDKDIVEKYIDLGRGDGKGGGLVYDTEDQELKDGSDRIIIQQTHMKFPAVKPNTDAEEDEDAVDGEELGYSWGKVPFIFLKGNEDELPLLNECKTDIDSYDLTKSKGIDSILDDIDAVLVVEGISAEMGELARARKLLQNSRIMAVDPGGNARFEKVNSDISAIVEQLDLLRKDVQDNTSTVDMTTIALGSNPSGKAMKTFYEPLNIWANGFEEQFRVYMKNLKYFFDLWLSLQPGSKSFEELQEIDITFTLDRDMLIDEDEIIANIMSLKDELSQETRDELNPYVEDHEKEEKRRKEDMEKAKKENELYNFGLDVNNAINKPEDEEENLEETDEDKEEDDEEEDDKKKPSQKDKK